MPFAAARARRTRWAWAAACSRARGRRRCAWADRRASYDARRRRDGRPLARLGTYQPSRTDEALTIDLAGIDAWVGQGAQLAETVAARGRKGRKAAAAAPATEAAPETAAAAAPPAEGA